MKRYFIYIIAMVGLLAGCTTDITDTPPMTEVGDIEITYSVAGEEVEVVTASALDQIVTIDVNINYPGIYWTPKSNKEWCKVVEEKHYGNGQFKLNIAANTGFYTRESATITLSAGEYSESVLQISQEGNVFVFDKRYETLSKAETTTTLKLSTPYEYEFEMSDWITVEESGKTTATDIGNNPYDIITLDVKASANNDSSRYGYLNIKRKGEEEVITSFNIWQFGNEVGYDEEGNILIAAQDAEPFEICAPKDLIEKVEVPEWVSLTKEESDDTTSYWLTCEDNPSDAFHVRQLELALTLLNESEAKPISFIKQNYYSVGGIISCHGLALFAKTYNEGGDCTPWYTDGKPLIINAIDMSELEDWTPIGTAERPFTGVFDGNLKSISNFTSSKPLFGYCSEATISNFVLDNTVAVTLSGNCSGNQYIAPLAYSIASNTTITGCSSNAVVSLDKMVATTNISVYVGGLVAMSDETSTISNSKMYGKIDNKSNSSTSTASTSQGNIYVGGIVARTSGKVENCVFGGNIVHAAVVKNAYIAGIAAYGNATSELTSNTVNGTLAYNSARVVAGRNDASRYCYLGGIAGAAEGKITGNTYNGRINTESNIKTIYHGGIVGCINNTTLTLSNNTTTASSRITAAGDARYIYLGSLTGCTNRAFTLDFTNDEGTFEGTLSAGNRGDGYAASSMYMGGLIGSASSEITLIAPKWSGKIDTNFTSDIFWGNAGIGGIIGAVGFYNDSGVNSFTSSISKASVDGTIEVSTANNAITGRMSMGGILGWQSGGATISDSNFSGTLAWLARDYKKNSNICTCGGIVGSIDRGDSSITNCHMTGTVFNWHYNNNGPASSDNGAPIPFSYNYTGGIIGSFGYISGVTDGITIENCSCSGNVNAFRGLLGGIAGYVTKATISSCHFTGFIVHDDSISHCNCIYGGIVATAANSSKIEECVVKADMSGKSEGSCPARAGGIAAILESSSTITNCKFYGNIDIALPAADEDPRDEYSGGIVGHAQSGTAVVDCCYGGYILAQYINTDELAAANALGTSTISKIPSEGTATNVTYWNGEE